MGTRVAASAAAVVEAVRSFVGRKLVPLEQRVTALERRMESEAKGFHYKGTWQSGEQYSPNDFVTYDGSIWYCASKTVTRPGNSDAWTLAVKRGRDRR